MTDYSTKSYGRNQEVAEIFRHFEAGRDLSLAGPRRLGKTFVLDRLSDAADGAGWTTVKIDVAGCGDTRAFFRSLCGGISRARSKGDRVAAWVLQRLGQLVDPRSDHSGEWYQALVSLDHESYFERLIKALHDDRERRWALLIDELPIFLKALHDKGAEGVASARNFMNLSSRLRAENPRVRWMITGSIGIEPLARAGNYMGVLAKFEPFDLNPLDQAQAMDFVQDLGKKGEIFGRTSVTDAEAKAVADAVGWRAAFYLEAVATKLSGAPSEDESDAKQAVEDAVQRLVVPNAASKFDVWPEHLRKHYQGADRAIAFAVLEALSKDAAGRSLEALMVFMQKSDLTKAALREILIRLHVEGFLSVSDWDGADPTVGFLNPLLRRWWGRFPPSPTA